MPWRHLLLPTQKIGTKPYVMHLTWTYSGAAGKRARARDAMMWYDAEEYYTGPSFVTIDTLQVPQVRCWQLAGLP
jgi:hypothetical protein